MARDTTISTSASTGGTIGSLPAAGQRILYKGKDYTTIKEGRAYILIPASASTVPQTTPKGDNEAQSVFYNPIQQFNRDLSVLVIKAYGEEMLEWKTADIQKPTGPRGDAKNGRRSRKRKRGENGGEGDKVEKHAKLQAHDKVEGPKNQLGLDTSTQEGIDTASASNSAENSFENDREAHTARLENTSSTRSVDDTTSSTVAPEAQPPRFTILDALSATGLRALRYAHEIPFVTSVTANDLHSAATETINMNVEHNKLKERISSTTENALSHMYNRVGGRLHFKARPRDSGTYDVIDLDPYGTAAPFLDAAVQAVRDDGGLLCVTCTDSGIWASVGYPEKCYSLYGGIPIKGVYCHEGGLRLLLHAIATSAARYGLAIEPLLSLSIDFYVRVFVRICKSPADVKFLAGKTMMVYSCDTGCGAWTTQLIAKNKLALNKNGNGTFYKHGVAGVSSIGDQCSYCGFKIHLAGPMFAGPLHSPPFIQRILGSLPHVSKEIYATKERMEGMLTLALEETLPTEGATNSSPSGADPSERLQPPPIRKGRPDPAAIDRWPFYFAPSALAKVLHCEAPGNDAIRGALMRLGYRATRSHAKAGSIKTDAPWSVIWEVMREWARQRAPITPGAVKEGTAGWTILGLDKDDEKAKQYFRKPRREEEKKPKRGEGGDDVRYQGKVGDGEYGGIEMEETEKKRVEEDMDVELDTATEAEDRGKIVECWEGKMEVVFDEKLGREKDGRNLVRYQMNPRENWGPMNKAKGHR